MSDTDWGDGGGEAAPKKKRRIPKWLWWSCGCGCLLMTLALAALVVFVTRVYREGTDPEKQWPRLGLVLHFEERPPGLVLEFGSSIGSAQFRLVDQAKELRATLVEYPAAASTDYHRLLEASPGLPLGLGEALDPERGTLVIQGQEVPFLRFTRIKPEPEGKGFGPGIRLDLTGARKQPRTLELRHLRPERIEDAEVEAFLAPFDVWREP